MEPVSTPYAVITPDEAAERLLAAFFQADSPPLTAELQGLLSLEVIHCLKSRVDREMLRDPGTALRVADAAVYLASLMDEPEASARALWSRGNALVFLTRYQEALACYQEARTIYERLGHGNDVVCIRINSVGVLQNMGEYESALRLADEARTICDALGPQARPFVPALEMNTGSIYQQLGDPVAALAAYERGHAAAVALGNTASIARLEINRANVLEELHRVAEAEGLLRGAREALEQAGFALEVARADLNLGRLAYRVGRYQVALRHLESARGGFGRLQSAGEVAQVDLYRSQVYRCLNLIQETISLAAAAEHSFREDRRRFPLALALINRASGYRRLGAYGQAEALLEEARELWHDRARIRLIELDLERGFLALEAGQPDKARALGQAIEEQLDATAWPVLAARLNLLMAQCALASSPPDLGQARMRVEAAREIAREKDQAEVAIAALHLSGQILERTGERVAALEQYRRAIAVIEQLRETAVLEELWLDFMEDKLAIYEDSVRLSQQLEAPEQVFATLHLAHAARFHKIETAQRMAGDDEDQALKRRLESLRESWHLLQSRLEGLEVMPDAPVHWEDRETADREQLSRLEAELAEVVRRRNIRGASESSNGLVRQALLFEEKACRQFVETVQRGLGAGEVLLHFYTVEDRFQAVVVRAGNIELVRDLAPAGALRRLLDAWRFHLEHTHLQVGSQGTLNVARAQLTRMYQALIAPLEAVLEGASQLHVLAPPVWHDIPFAALFDGKKYLIERVCITHRTSLDALASGEPEGVTLEPSRANALVVGYSDGGRLEHAVREAQAVAGALSAHWSTTVVLEADAVVERFRAACQDCALVHLATHATFRPDNPRFSSMRFADGWLTVADLHDIALPRHPLVVLSACETGRGQPRGGGLLGMGQAFLAAGASGLVVSLWKVADESSARLMTDLYRWLTPSASPVAGLRAAQRAAIDRGDHPYHWAGFIFVKK